MLNKLIDIALSEIGYREGANNNNKYGIEYGLNNQPWCVIFVWWCFKRLTEWCGIDIGFGHLAHCNGVEQYAKEHGQWVTSDYKVGDCVIFDYEKDGTRDHIGIVIEAENGYVKTTIEGNYSDKVAKVNRRTDCTIIGAFRPKYVEVADDTFGDALDVELEPEVEDTSTPSKLPELDEGDYGKAVGSLQLLLKWNGFAPANSFDKKGRPDRDFGNGTAKALQSFCGKNHVDEEVWRKLIGGVG